MAYRAAQMAHGYIHALNPGEQKNQSQQIALPVCGGLVEYAVELATRGADRDRPFFAVVVEGQTVRKKKRGSM